MKIEHEQALHQQRREMEHDRAIRQQNKEQEHERAERQQEREMRTMGLRKYGRERSYADVAAQSLPSNNRYHDRSQDRNYVRHCHSDEDDDYGWEVVGRKRH